MNRTAPRTQKRKSLKRKAYEFAVLTIIGVPAIVLIGAALIVSAVCMGLRQALIDTD